MTRLTKAKFKAALEGSGGVQAVIAQKCGVDRSTISRYLDKHPDMKILQEAEMEKILGVAENKLHALINDKNIKAIKFFLETKGKKRGYVPASYVEQDNKEDVTITVVRDG